MTTDYTVVYFTDGNGWGAAVPDLPGCQTCGADLAQVRERIKEAVEGLLAVAREDGAPIPAPSNIVVTMNVEISA